MAKYEEIAGAVEQTNKKNGGIKLGGEWYDWSQYSDQKGDERPVPRSGQEVVLHVDNSGRIRKVTGPGGSELAAGGVARGSSNGYVGDDYARSYRPEDQWRMTLLSCMRASAQIIPSLIKPDGRVGEGDKALTPSAALYAMSLFLANKVVNEPVPQAPKPPEAAQVSQ